MLLMLLILFRAPTFEPQPIVDQPVGTVFYWRGSQQKLEVTEIVYYVYQDRDQTLYDLDQTYYVLEECFQDGVKGAPMRRYVNGLRYPEWEIIYSPEVKE